MLFSLIILAIQAERKYMHSISNLYRVYYKYIIYVCVCVCVLFLLVDAGRLMHLKLYASDEKERLRTLHILKKMRDKSSNSS